MKRMLVTLVIYAVFGAALTFADSNAAKECSMPGTWSGVGDSGTTWIDVASRGVNATAGQFTMEWVSLDPTLGGYFPKAIHVTPGVGIWQLVKSKFQYTWTAYAFDAKGAEVYLVRTSGTKSKTDCNHLSITYVLQLWLPTQDPSVDEPYWCAPGTATETRIPIVQATCD